MSAQTCQPHNARHCPVCDGWFDPGVHRVYHAEIARRKAVEKRWSRTHGEKVWKPKPEPIIPRVVPVTKKHPINVEELSEAFPTIEQTAIPCAVCGKPSLPGPGRRIVIQGGDPLLRVAIYCSPKCFGEQPEADGREQDWERYLTGLSRELTKLAPRVWELHRGGLSQSQIGERLGVGQQTISRVVRAIKAAQQTARDAQIRPNGINGLESKAA